MYNYRRAYVGVQVCIQHALALDSPSVVGTPSVIADVIGVLTDLVFIADNMVQKIAKD